MSASHLSKNIVGRIKIWVKECFYFYIMVLRWCWNAVRKKKILENSCCSGKNHFFWNWIHPLLCYQSLDGGSGIYNIQVVLQQLPRHNWKFKFSHGTFGHHDWNSIFATSSLGAELAGEHHPRPQSCPSCPGHDFQSSDLSLPFRARFYCCWVPHLNSRGLKWFPRHKVLLHSQVLEVKHPISTVWGFYLQGGLRLAWAHSRHPDGIRRASPGWLQLSSHNSISAEGLLGLGSVLPDDVRSALLWQMSAICTAAPASLGEGQKNNPVPLLSPRILSGAVLIPVRLDNQGQTPRLAIRGSLEPGIDKSGDKHIIPRIQLSSCSLPALQQPWPDVGIQHISLFPPSRFTKLSLPIAL